MVLTKHRVPFYLLSILWSPSCCWILIWMLVHSGLIHCGLRGFLFWARPSCNIHFRSLCSFVSLFQHFFKHPSLILLLPPFFEPVFITVGLLMFGNSTSHVEVDIVSLLLTMIQHYKSKQKTASIISMCSFCLSYHLPVLSNCNM